MRTPGRPKFVLSVDAFNADKLNGLLGQFGLRLGAQPARPSARTWRARLEPLPGGRRLEHHPEKLQTFRNEIMLKIKGFRALSDST
jgi:hypothetical protein